MDLYGYKKGGFHALIRLQKAPILQTSTASKRGIQGKSWTRRDIKRGKRFWSLWFAGTPMDIKGADSAAGHHVDDSEAPPDDIDGLPF